MLRLTAKSTQFGRKTFTSWLIESAGTVPLKRRKDYEQGSINDADNSDVMEKLMEVSISVCAVSRHNYQLRWNRLWKWETPYASFLRAQGECQLLMLCYAIKIYVMTSSRYHPTIAPLKTGGAIQSGISHPH
jgi:hypothetical protein